MGSYSRNGGTEPAHSSTQLYSARSSRMLTKLGCHSTLHRERCSAAAASETGPAVRHVYRVSGAAADPARLTSPWCCATRRNERFGATLAQVGNGCEVENFTTDLAHFISFNPNSCSRPKAQIHHPFHIKNCSCLPARPARSTPHSLRRSAQHISLLIRGSRRSAPDRQS